VETVAEEEVAAARAPSPLAHTVLHHTGEVVVEAVEEEEAGVVMAACTLSAVVVVVEAVEACTSLEPCMEAALASVGASAVT